MVAVTVRMMDRRAEVTLQKVQAVLKVTPKQAEVARAVMQGLSPPEFAEKSGCSLKMARFHLYELMRKLGCRSQAELGTYLIRTFE
jgi:DNA-binding CsgD family transcriptional regulator